MSKKKTTEKAPEWSEWFSLDAVAECLSYQKFLPVNYTGDLYSKLWRLQHAAKNPSPIGGDGTGGTTETPDGRIGNYDDSLSSVWKDLTGAERFALNCAYAKEHGTDIDAILENAYGVNREDLKQDDDGETTK